MNFMKKLNRNGKGDGNREDGLKDKKNIGRIASYTIDGTCYFEAEVTDVDGYNIFVNGEKNKPKSGLKISLGKYKLK